MRDTDPTRKLPAMRDLETIDSELRLLAARFRNRMRGHPCGMIARRILRLLAPAVVAASGVSVSVFASAIPSASADPCPDLQVVFARGTDDPPGVGPTGQAFIDSLRPRLGPRSFQVYPVNYPASDDWPTGVNGIKDASAHVIATAANCPTTARVQTAAAQ